MASGKKAGLTAGLGGVVLWALPWRRAIMTVVVARRVWKDPRVQKVRRQVEKRVRKSRARAAKH